jgi:hypothetical protein
VPENFKENNKFVWENALITSNYCHVMVIAGKLKFA